MLVHQYMVVQEKLTDLAPFGPGIERKCNSADSFLMEKRHLIGENHNSKLGFERGFDVLLICFYRS